MPKVLDIDGFRFFFFSEEGNDPVHVHSKKGDAEAKFWLEPIEAVYSVGFNPNQLRRLTKILREHADELAQKYKDRIRPND